MNRGLWFDSTCFFFLISCTQVIIFYGKIISEKISGVKIYKTSERGQSMWVYLTVALGGFLIGFIARMIQQSFTDVRKSVGTLNVVKIGDNPEDLLLELEEPPDKWLNGQAIMLLVKTTRR